MSLEGRLAMINNIGICCFSFIAGMVLGILLLGLHLQKICRDLHDKYEKQTEFYSLLLRWIHVHQEGRTLMNYFYNNNVRTIAIYGMKELGEALSEELRNGDIEIKYGIDKNADNIYAGIDVYTPDEKLEDVDMVVVTAIHYYNEIENDMQNKLKGKIVSLEDVVWEA